MTKKSEELVVPFWVIDGFVGILALMIYNFLLYILTIIGIRGIIGKMQDTVGYFGLNTFLDFSFSPGAIALGLILIFALSFIIGIIIGKFVRKRKKRN